jgi:hypothetical protein
MLALTRTGYVALALAGAISASGWFWQAGLLKDNQCDERRYPLGDSLVTVPALKVVIEPWAGRHHVYALFALPETCWPGRPMALTVTGVGRFCDSAQSLGSQQEGVTAPPGHYLMRGYIHTRTALWLLLRGQGDRLRQPGNWTLSCAVTPP